MKTDDHQGSPKTESQEDKAKRPKGAEKKAPGNALRRLQIIEVLADPSNRGKKRTELAKIIGISDRQLRKYITPNLLHEVRALYHKNHVTGEMLDVDKAMLRKASKDADVPAAKLMYQRFDGLGTHEGHQETPLVINIIPRADAGTAASGVRIRARRGK